MQPNREQLGTVAETGLRGSSLRISWSTDRRQYQLLEMAGRGQTGVAWRASDARGRTFAIKFVIKADYGTHSLDAETRNTDGLPSRLFARIEFFGSPEFLVDGIDCSPFYAIVVDWIDGRSLRSFLADASTIISPDTLLRLARDMCAALQVLKDANLSHSDLHDENILIRVNSDALASGKTYELVVIDTGQLKTRQRRVELLEQWEQQLDAIESLPEHKEKEIHDAAHELRNRISYFKRTDQEWVVSHLCSLFNRMHRNLATLDGAGKRFVRDLPELLRAMIDADRSRRIDDPKRMFAEIESLSKRCLQPGRRGMTSPFDLPSAELIRSDKELMALFSDEYPRLDACRSAEPIYLYGPRGCGKSTILRSLSLKAILESDRPGEEFEKSPFLGVYLSASQELRSRFWLMKESDFEAIESHAVRYFNLLLIESFVETLDIVFRFSASGGASINFQLTETTSRECTQVFRTRLALGSTSTPYVGQSYFQALRDDIRRERDALWISILDRDTPKQRTDAQVVFDICRELEAHWHFLRTHPVVFLIDDYSNQRIPVGLQKRLNQSITFAKQGRPIFKVASEYDGVDLEGVQEGREVHEVNVGSEYVSLKDAGRYRFLQNVLERRFKYMERPTELSVVLGLSNVEPATAMARAIREAKEGKRRFYYHGLDTLSDLCSGDFAMGIDLVRRVFEAAEVDWRSPSTIPAPVQDRVIREYAKHEFEYIRYQSRNGRIKYRIADRLCWLSKECILTKDTTKDANKGTRIPVVKNHVDIANTALQELQDLYPDSDQLLRELVSRGVLFPLQTSRARQGRDTTYRVMVRRILLAQYSTALGRDVPIRIDDVQRLQYLLTDPDAFVDDELRKTSPPESDESKSRQSHSLQMKLPLDEGADA